MTHTLPMTESQFFDWMRGHQHNKKLTQDMVDGAKQMIALISIEELKEALALINGWHDDFLIKPTVNPSKVTRVDIQQAAKDLNIEPAMIKALSDIESPKGGFNQDGTPKILFERHKFYEGLTEINWLTKRNDMRDKYPDVCNEDSGDYNARPQYDKLKIASKLNWDVAHESASWGFGQVMGFNWKLLGYSSINDFITRMYASEGEQLIAACRYIKHKGLDKKLRAKDWAGFAKGYNGSDYKRNNYDNKLSAAYIKAKKEGW